MTQLYTYISTLSKPIKNMLAIDCFIIEIVIEMSIEHFKHIVKFKYSILETSLIKLDCANEI